MATKQNLIVVAVDGSEASTAAVRWAANTAAKRGVPLQLATSYVIPPVFYSEGLMPSDELLYDIRAESEEKIEQARAIALEVAPGLEIEDTIVEGNPIDMLLDISRDVTTIVMGSRGLGGIPGMVMGSVSSAVVSHAACPVVIVRADSIVNADNKYGPVVVGADGSKVSQRAMEYAFAEAHARRSELIAVHTWMDLPARTSILGLGAAQMTWNEVEKQQSKLLAERLQPLIEKYPDVKVTKVVTRGVPVRSLAEQAEGAQLLIVGSHGRGGFRGMLLGSTSRALLRFAPCPLMVVRPENGE